MRYSICLLCLIICSISAPLISTYAVSANNNFSQTSTPGICVEPLSNRPGSVRLIAQAVNTEDRDSGIKSVSVSISYNARESDLITSETLDNIEREIYTTFIGSGYRYSSESNSDISIKATLDVEIKSYELENKNVNDIVSKIDLKSYNRNNELLKEASKSIFLSGNDIKTVVLNASRKSASVAAKDLVDQLESVYGTNPTDNTTQASIKIEIIFNGSNNFKLFNDLNKILLDSPYQLQLLKRTFEPGSFFSVVALSHVESDILASYIKQHIESAGNLQLSDVQRNRIVFDIITDKS